MEEQNRASKGLTVEILIPLLCFSGVVLISNQNDCSVTYEKVKGISGWSQ